ncbi:hypothetical protein IU414_06495 [Nocardia farcinica]|nr:MULTISPECIES: hypothetical protein [Nocardia]MBF6187631.1 hypothetical protein [Nocardia farcinica]MBF6254423.1 hypothetical protein [Nocardia farcinica]MBF6315026.1 hypothetical protein [Nocardia farcinica]MBF6363194.1 hypothetical protein [Nocardia farcinica]MBF6422005.1 hypothetical protein [Nocardia farcinica]
MAAVLVTDGLDSKLTAVEASAIFSVTAATIRKWASLGKLAAVGMDARNRKLYRLADIAACEKATRHAAGRGR